MAKLLIYLITVETSHAAKKRSIDNSFVLLKDHMKTCNAMRQKNHNLFDSILVAPEYLFSHYAQKKIGFFKKNPVAGQRIAIPKNKKDNILARLKNFSKQYSKTIIIPGTIYYEENIATGEKKDEVSKSLLIREFELRHGNSSGDKIIKPSERRGIEVMNYNPKTNGSDMADKLKTFTKEMQKQPVKAVKNTCVILFNSEVVAGYEKKTGFNETYDRSVDEGFFVSTNKNSCPVIGGFRFGVEICFDHNQGVLKKRNASDLFFHVVVSDFVETKKGNIAVQEGGYFIHSSSDSSQTMVKEKKLNVIQDCIIYKSGPNYKAYLLDIPDRV
jgi:predicted amidohydrolase